VKSNRVLAMVSAAQLGCGLAGLILAIRRRRAFDIPFWRGQPSAVSRDSMLMGTALSAPAGMLAAQAWAVTVLVRRPDACAAQRTLGALGATMTAGYLAERLVRHRLTPAGWDNAESSVVTAGLSLAAAMALMGMRSSQPVRQGRR
jgi:hypothetical protein